MPAQSQGQQPAQPINAVQQAPHSPEPEAEQDPSSAPETQAEPTFTPDDSLTSKPIPEQTWRDARHSSQQVPADVEIVKHVVHQVWANSEMDGGETAAGHGFVGKHPEVEVDEDAANDKNVKAEHEELHSEGAEESAATAEVGENKNVARERGGERHEGLDVEVNTDSKEEARKRVFDSADNISDAQSDKQLWKDYQKTVEKAGAEDIHELDADKAGQFVATSNVADLAEAAVAARKAAEEAAKDAIQAEVQRIQNSKGGSDDTSIDNAGVKSEHQQTPDEHAVPKLKHSTVTRERSRRQSATATAKLTDKKTTGNHFQLLKAGDNGKHNLDRNSDLAEDDTKHGTQDSLAEDLGAVADRLRAAAQEPGWHDDAEDILEDVSKHVAGAARKKHHHVRVVSLRGASSVVDTAPHPELPVPPAWLRERQEELQAQQAPALGGGSAPAAQQLMSSSGAALAGRSSPSRSAAAAWRPALQQASDGSQNLCSQGRLLPEVFLLGAQKSATSSMAWDLLGTGIEAVGDENWKEFHFFDSRMQWGHWGNGGLDHEAARWRASLPECREGDKRRVAADLTPSYMRMVPLPDGIVPNGGMPPMNYDAAGHPQSGTINLPQIINHFYDNLADRVTFLVMLREPLARMQSAFYAAKKCDFKCICMGCKAESFSAALDDHLGKAVQQKVSDWIWTSTYAAQIDGWLAVFQPSQLVVVPYLAYVSGDKDSICRTMSLRTGYQMDCDSHGNPAAHKWKNPHPSLAEDVSSQALLESWNAYMGPEVDRLVATLARAQQGGAMLVAYGGAAGSEVEIRQWLLSNW